MEYHKFYYEGYLKTIIFFLPYLLLERSKANILPT